MGIPADAIGVIGDGQRTVGRTITVALVQTLYKCAPAVARDVGFLVVDECHRCPSRTFTEAVTAFDSAYMLGLSATPWRRDGLSRLIYLHLGSKVHEIERGALVEEGHILAAEVIFRKTAYEPLSDPSEEYSRMLVRAYCKPQTQHPDRPGRTTGSRRRGSVSGVVGPEVALRNPGEDAGALGPAGIGIDRRPAYEETPGDYRSRK